MMVTRRIYVKKKEPNPLFRKWLEEWTKEAEGKGKQKLASAYKVALSALCKFPLTLYSGSDCVILEGFGPKICDMLNVKLEQYLKELPDIDKELSFKEKIEILRERDRKELEKFLNDLETEFDPRVYECDENSDSDSEIEEEIPFTPANLSVSVIKNNLTIQDILNEDDNDCYEDRVRNLSFNVSAHGKEECQIQEDINYEPPKKLSRISSDSSEDEFDLLVKKAERKSPPRLHKKLPTFEIRLTSKSPGPEEIENELNRTSQESLKTPLCNPSSKFRRSKTFSGLESLKKPLSFSTPIGMEKKTDIKECIDLSQSPERDESSVFYPPTPLPTQKSLPFSTTAKSSNFKSPQKSFESEKSHETPSKSPDFIIDLSQSPEPEEIERELSKHSFILNQRKTLRFEESPMKIEPDKFASPVTKILRRESPLDISSHQELENSIDKIIAGYGLSPISKDSKKHENKAEKNMKYASNYPPEQQNENSVPSNRKSFRRSKTFGAGSSKMDDSIELTIMPNFAAPEAKLQSPLTKFDDDDIDRIIAKYGTPKVTQTQKKAQIDKAKSDMQIPDDSSKNTKLPKSKTQSKLVPSHLTVKQAIQQKSTFTKTKSTPIVRSISSSSLTATSSIRIEKTQPLQRIGSQANQEDDELRFISVDEINTDDFDVVLMVDTQETSGKQKSSSDSTVNGLKENNIKFEVRKLNVGDFLWIAKHKTDKNLEYVLPYIVERKRLDDYSASIKDGRFHEQKFRLKKSGIENVVYLIESHPKTRQYATMGLPFTTLLQAATNTQIQSKFTVKFTESLEHSLLYLTVMTGFIENIFKKKAPLKFQLTEFQKFNKSAVKQRKCNVRETFIKQLLALKGVSVNIAIEIASMFSTPKDLYLRYKGMSREEGEKLLSSLPLNGLKKSIPTNISKAIYYLYTNERPT